MKKPTTQKELLYIIEQQEKQLAEQRQAISRLDLRVRKLMQVVEQTKHSGNRLLTEVKQIKSALVKR